MLVYPGFKIGFPGNPIRHKKTGPIKARFIGNKQTLVPRLLQEQLVSALHGAIPNTNRRRDVTHDFCSRRSLLFPV